VHKYFLAFVLFFVLKGFVVKLQWRSYGSVQVFYPSLQTLTHFYESGTIQQLREIAKYLEVKGISRLSKKPLVALLIDKSPSHIEEWRRFLRLPCLAGGMLKNYISVWVAGCFHFTMFKCIQPA